MDFGAHEFEGDAVFRINADVNFMDGLTLAAGLMADAANTLSRSAQVALEKWEVQP